MSRSTFLRGASLLFVACSMTLGACNALTGVEDLVIEGEWEGGGGEGAGSGEGAGPGTGGTTGTVTTSTTPGVVFVEAPGVGITQIALYQGVKAVLMEGGNPVATDIPIVAGRDALMRVSLSVDGDYDGKPVTARLHIEGAPAPIEYVGPVPGAPVESTLSSTLNFDIPGASIGLGFSFRVEILQPDSGRAPGPAARYPAQGFAKTSAASAGQSLKIVLVPIRYGGDGSNRLPDTSASMIQGYEDLFYAMYPVPQIDLTVRAAVTYGGSVSANGSGWDNLLGALGQLRADDDAPFDVYYYGIFAPASSLSSFCGGGCVSGLGNIGGPGDSYSRAAIGLGFGAGAGNDGGQTAWETAVHEIGHTHGRYHSPCGGAQGTDPGYPHSGGKTGVWGYNLLTKKLYSPQGHTDVMGYCQPIWVSDFTYKGFFNRIKAVNGANIIVPPDMLNRTYDRVKIDGDGNVEWLPSFAMKLPPQADPIELTVETDSGTEIVTGQRYAYDHLPGGVILWPQAGGPTATVSFNWNGSKKSVSR